MSVAYAMDGLIEGSGVGYRALRMPAFVEDVLNFQAGPIEDEGVLFGSQYGDRKVPTVATDLDLEASRLEA